jgi:hypothetical protein
MKIPHQNPHTALAGAEQAALDAQATLEDPGLRAAFKRLQEHYLMMLRQTKPEDREDREGCYYLLRALDVLATDLQRVVTNVEFDRRSYRRIMREEHTQ